MSAYCKTIDTCTTANSIDLGETSTNITIHTPRESRQGTELNNPAINTGDALHQNICALHNPAVTITTLDLCLAQPCMQNTKRELKVSTCVLSGMVSVND